MKRDIHELNFRTASSPAYGLVQCARDTQRERFVSGRSTMA